MQIPTFPHKANVTKLIPLHKFLIILEYFKISDIWKSKYILFDWLGVLKSEPYSFLPIKIFYTPLNDSWYRPAHNPMGVTEQLADFFLKKEKLILKESKNLPHFHVQQTIV